MSRVTWQPSNAQPETGSDRSCQRRSGGSGDRPCSKKTSFAAGFEHPAYSLNGFEHAGNRAKSKCAHHGINAPVRRGNGFSRQLEKLDIQLGSAPLLFCPPNHPWAGFECVDLVYLCRIVNERSSRRDRRRSPAHSHRPRGRWAVESARWASDFPAGLQHEDRHDLYRKALRFHAFVWLTRGPAVGTSPHSGQKDLPAAALRITTYPEGTSLSMLRR
jgi:hypothetical protein